MTGGAGFIGAHLVNRLVSIQAGEISRASLPPAIDFRKGDIGDQHCSRHALRIQEVEDPLWALPKLLSGPAQYAAR